MPTWIHEGKLLLMNLISFHDKVFHLADQGKLPNGIIFVFQQHFQYHTSHYPSGQNAQHTARQKHNVMGEQLTDGSHSSSW